MTRHSSDWLPCPPGTLTRAARSPSARPWWSSRWSHVAAVLLGVLVVAAGLYAVRPKTRSDLPLSPVPAAQVGCREFPVLMEAYTANGLDAAERSAFEQHLQHCPHCRDRLEQFLRSREPGPAPPSHSPLGVSLVPHPWRSSSGSS